MGQVITGAPTGAISLDYAKPPESLRGHLSVFYDFHADVSLFEDSERADLAQFRYMLAGGPGTYRFADGHVAPTPLIQLVGPTTGVTHVRVAGPLHIFGVGLLAAGWGTLLDFEASLLVNRVIDATELLGPSLYGVADALRAATTIDERVTIACRVATDLISRGRTDASDFTRLVDDWLASAPSPALDELVRAVGLSRRQVERRCNAYYGAPPKLLARKYRALKAAIALAKGEADAEELQAAGFYDQSHFIREIKAFTGVTPSKIVEGLPTLAQLTLKRTEFVELGPLVTKT